MKLTSFQEIVDEAENSKANEKTSKTFEEKKLLEIYGLYLKQCHLNRGLDLSDFSEEVYYTWMEE